MRLHLIIFCLLSMLTWNRAEDAAATETKPQATVDGLLFFMSDEPLPPATDSEKEVEKAFPEKQLADMKERLAKTFKKKNYRLLGTHSQDVLKDYESWVVPSKDICLKIDSRGPNGSNGINLHIQLWQEKKVLVKSDVTLKAGQPIFIGGPDWRKGRLVFVVVMK